MLGRKAEPLRRRVVADDAARRHGAQPFADIALVESGARGELLAGQRRRIGQRVKQAGPVTDADHQPQHGIVEDIDHAPGECLRLRLGCQCHLAPSDGRLRSGDAVPSDHDRSTVNRGTDAFLPRV
jgi:hypothetical protein